MCELIKKYSASLYNLSHKISKYASDIDHAVTFSSEEFKQYQIELQTSLSNKEKQLSYAL